MFQRNAKLIAAFALLMTVVLSACAPTNIQATFYCDSIQITYTAQGGTSSSGFTPSSGPLYAYDAAHNKIGTGFWPAQPAGSTQQASVSFPMQPEGSTLTVEIVSAKELALNTFQSIPTDITGTCHGSASSSGWNPGDNRADGKPWDRISLYCNMPSSGQLDVWGINDAGKGFHLTTFNASDIAKAGPKGIYQKVSGTGTVSVSTDGKNNYWVAWNGPVTDKGDSFYADGQPSHGFAKGINCTLG